MMSAAQSQTTLCQLEALQCHFTWNLDRSRSKLLYQMEKLVDIGTEEGNRWLGHIYNLRGFIQYKLGSTEDAQSFFNEAAEAFRQMRDAYDGPWLVVNYGNLAWLHHHLGDQAESEAYLSKVDALMQKYPSPSQDELHAETYAEKAWTLMKFSTDRELVADYFQRAISMQPDMVEWNTSHVIRLAKAFKFSDTGLEADLLEKMRVAKEQDPENLYLAAYYLQQRAKKGEDVKAEAPAETLIHVFITSRLDDCNSILYATSTKTINKLQYIQNSSAHLLSHSTRDHITPVLQNLHWLPIQQRTQFKILLITYKALHNPKPLHTFLTSCTHTLRPATSHLPMPTSFPPTLSKHRTWGDRAFSIAAPPPSGSLSPAPQTFCVTRHFLNST